MLVLLLANQPSPSSSYQQDFQVADQAGWPGWNAAGGTLAITGGVGTYTTGSTTGYAGGNAQLVTPALTLGSVDFSGTLVMAQAGVEQYVEISIDSSGTQTSGAYYPTQGFSIQLNYNATAASSTVQLYSVAGGSATAIGAAVTFTLTGTTTYGFRLQRIGTTINWRLWDASGAEPGTWTGTGTSSLGYTGTVNLAVVNGAAAVARTATFDNLNVFDPTAAPAYTASPALSGSGTLTSASASGSTPALSGSGSLLGTPVAAPAATVALSGSGSMSTGTGGPTTLATETFTGTNGAAWGSQWSTTFGGTATIQSNQGQYAAGSTSAYAGGHKNLTGMSAVSDCDVSLTLAMTGSGIEQYAIVGVAGSGTDSSGAYYMTQGYALQLNFNATAASSTVQLLSVTGGSSSQIAQVTETLAGATTYSVRIRRVGTSLQARIWTGTEPSTWDISATLATAFTGVPFVGVSNGAAATQVIATFDNVVVTDAATGGGGGAVGYSAFPALTGSGSLASTPSSSYSGPLLQWANALSTVSSAPAKVLALGASFVEGQGASVRTARWWDKFRTSLQSSYPSGATGGDGYLPAWYGVYASDSTWGEWRTSSSGTVTNDQTRASLGMRTAVMSAGAVRTYTVTGTDVDIWYGGASDAGAFTWSIDGGSATSVTAPTTTSVNNRVQVTGLSAASHTVTVTATGKTYLQGFTVFNGDRSKGVQTFDAAHTAWDTDKYTNLGSEFDALLNTVGPDLVILTDTSLNDASNGYTVSNVQTLTQTLITRIKALTKVPSILLIADYRPQTDTSPAWSTYVSMLSSLASSNSIGFLDISAVMGPATTSGLYRSDGLHPSDTGHTAYAGYVTSAASVSNGAAGVAIQKSVALAGSGSLSSSGSTTSTGTAALAGSGTLASSGAPKPTSAPALSGSGSLLGTPVPAFLVAAALSGSGALASSGTPTGSGSTALSGSGSLTSSGSTAISAPAALSGSGALSTAAAANTAGAATLSGSGSLTGSSLASPAQSAAFAGSGSLTDTATLNIPAAVPLSGTGVLAAATSTGAIGAAGLAGSGSLSGSGVPALTAATALSGSGVLAASGTPTGSGSTALAGSGSLAASPAVAVPVAAALSGSGTLASSGAPKPVRAVALSGSGALATAGVPKPTATTALSGSGSLAPVTSPAPAQTVALAGSGSLSSSGAYGPTGVPAFTGSGALASGATVTASGSAPLSGEGLLESAGGGSAPGIGTLYGTGDLDTTAVPAFTGSTALTGSGSLAGVPAPSFALGAALSGSGALTAGATPKPVRTVALSGTGVLGRGTPVVKPSQTVTLSGVGALATAGVPAGNAPGALSGSGALSPAQIPAVAVTAPLAGTGSLSPAAGPVTAAAPVSLSGVGALNSAGGGNSSATAALGGSGQLGDTGLPAFPRAAGFSGLGSVSTSGKPTPAVTVNLSGSGQVTVTGFLAPAGPAPLTGEGLLSTAAAFDAATGGALSGLGVLVGTPRLTVLGHLTGSGALAAVGLFSTYGDPLPEGLQATAMTSGLRAMSALSAVTASAARGRLRAHVRLEPVTVDPESAAGLRHVRLGR